MNLLYKRPLAAVASVFAVGSFFFFLLPTPWRVAGGVLLSLLGVLFLFLPVRRHIPALFLSAALGACVITLFFDVARLPLRSYEEKHVTVIGNVAEISYRNDDYVVLCVSCDAIDGEVQSFKAAAACLATSEIEIGDRVVLCGDLQLLSARDFFDESLSYPLADGVTVILEDATLRNVEKTENLPVTSFFARLRAVCGARIESAVPGESGHLLSTLLLGAYTVSGKTVIDFRYTGLLPLLAISGTHFTVLSFALLFLLKRLRIGMRGRTLLLLAFLIFYTALSGFLPSVMRAALMLICSLLGYLTGRPYDSLTGLALSSAGLLLAFPYLIGNTGFLLSVTATFGILFFGEAVKKTRFDPYRIENPLLQLLYASFFLTASAVAATLPVVALLCGEVSFLSFLGNLCLSPLMDLLLFLAGAVLLCPIPPIAGAADLLTKLLLFLLGRLARIPNMLLSLRPLPVQIGLFLLVFWLVFSLAVWKKDKAHPRRTVACLLLFVFAYTALFPITSRIGIRYIYNGEEGAESLLLYGDSAAVLYDCTSGDKSSLARAVKNARKAAVPEIDALLLTGYRNRLPEDLRRSAAAIKLRRLILPHPSTEEERHLAAKLCDIATAYDIETTFYTPAAVIRIGGITCIHHPPYGSARLISFRARDKVITYMTTDYHNGIYHNTVLDELAESDLLILGAGKEGSPAFPYPLPKKDPPRVLVADKSLAALWRENSLPEAFSGADVTLEVHDCRGYLFD